MELITKDTLSSLLEYYHYFHDSYVLGINYDVNKAQIEIMIDVGWSGKPKLKKDGYYETNKTKVKLTFYDVEQCNNKEIFSWDYINEAYLEYIKVDNKEFLCFASDEEEPFVYIVCEKIEYEELK